MFSLTKVYLIYMLLFFCIVVFVCFCRASNMP